MTQTIISDSSVPKILVRKEVINMPATSVEQEYFIQDLFDKMTTYNIFYTIDDNGYLFPFPSNWLNNEPPIWTERIKGVNIFGYYSNRIVDESVNYSPQTFSILAADFNAVPTTHVLTFYIFLYGEVLER